MFTAALFTITSTITRNNLENYPAMQKTQVWFLGRKILRRRNRLPTPLFLGFPCGSAGKQSARNAGNLGSIPGLGRSPGEGKGYPLQYSGLENSIEWIVHGVTKSQTWLSNLKKKKYPEIPLLGIYPKESKIEKDIYTPKVHCYLQ